jgi:hypothetical protein
MEKWWQLLHQRQKKRSWVQGMVSCHHISVVSYIGSSCRFLTVESQVWTKNMLNLWYSSVTAALCEQCWDQTFYHSRFQAFATFFDTVILEGGTSKFSWNTGNKPTYTAQKIRRVKTWKFFRLILSLPALWYYLVCFELTPCYLLPTYKIL